MFKTNLFDNYNSLVLLQKLVEFSMVFSRCLIASFTGGLKKVY